MSDAHAHWETVYQTRQPSEVSWFQAQPAPSLSLLKTQGVPGSASIIDVGGGASTLVDNLLEQGFNDLTVLDISPTALGHAKKRLGKAGEAVEWIEADMTSWHPARVYDVWHDRAAFHFLGTAEAQAAYLGVLDAATRAGSLVIVATFALDGPERCSGIAVQRYSADTLPKRLGPHYSLIAQQADLHNTPAASLQKFTFSVFRKQ